MCFTQVAVRWWRCLHRRQIGERETELWSPSPPLLRREAQGEGTIHSNSPSPPSRAPPFYQEASDHESVPRFSIQEQRRASGDRGQDSKPQKQQPLTSRKPAALPSPFSGRSAGP